MKSKTTTDGIPPERQFNRAQLAEFWGVALTTIDIWIRRGCPVIRRGSRGVPAVFDILAVAEWRYAAKTAAVVSNPEDLEPRDRRDWYAGEEIRLRTENNRQRLMAADVAAFLISSMFAEIRAMLLGHHNTIARAIPDLPAEVVADIQRLNRETLNKLSANHFPETIQTAIEELTND
jgi:phage terminase Nu1 subunit (DNA packaging protein)